MTGGPEREEQERVRRRRRRGGTVLAALGLVATVIGFVWMPFTDPAAGDDPLDARLLAVTLSLSGLAFLISGIVMRRTPAGPWAVPARPRRYWLVLAAFGLVGLVYAALTYGATDWTRYFTGGYLFAFGLAAYLFEHIQVRRRRRRSRAAKPSSEEAGPE